MSCENAEVADSYQQVKCCAARIVGRKKNSGEGGIHLGHGERLLVNIEVILANHLMPEERSLLIPPTKGELSFALKLWR